MTMRKLLVSLIPLILLVSIAPAGCSAVIPQQGETGTLRFKANGEDFVRQGFVSKDDWTISFDHVYVTLANVSAYQSDPPYDPHSSDDIQSQYTVVLDKPRTVDLAKGGENAPSILVEEMADAPVGHYNAISWEMTPASDGSAAGYSLVIVGAAEQEGETVNFTIKIGMKYVYTCGEYVGDERKGILQADDVADVEMTFHFDHIFGDAETPLDDELNVAALGFEPFAAVAEGGVLDVDLAGLQEKLSTANYQKLVNILPTLGHVGEGHCQCERR